MLEIVALHFIWYLFEFGRASFVVQCWREFSFSHLMFVLLLLLFLLLLLLLLLIVGSPLIRWKIAVGFSIILLIFQSFTVLLPNSCPHCYPRHFFLNILAWWSSLAAMAFDNLCMKCSFSCHQQHLIQLLTVLNALASQTATPIDHAHKFNSNNIHDGITDTWRGNWIQPNCRAKWLPYSNRLPFSLKHCRHFVKDTAGIWSKNEKEEEQEEEEKRPSMKMTLHKFLLMMMNEYKW